MPYGKPSGVATYAPYASDMTLDALARCNVFSPETKHMQAARRSANLILASKWSNRGLNLWKVDAEPTVIPLIQGVAGYLLTPDVIGMFDTYRRSYQMNAPVSAPINFSTVMGSSSVLIGLANAGVAVGNYTQVALQVSVGGLLLYGFYPVTSTPSPNSFTINAATNAIATVNNGGVVPVFTTTNLSAVVAVNLPNHGLLAGQPFVVPVATQIGGITISGSYPVTTVTDADHFTITAAAQANSPQTVTENNGQAFIATQTVTNGNSGYTDTLMSPFSRTDYAGQADKMAPGAPTTYFYEKQNTPQFKTWPVADNTGPYEMHAYLMRQINVVNPTGGETLDMPNRFLYPFVCDLAADLSISFNVQKYPTLKGIADEAWADASATDVENVVTRILPNFAGYGV